MKKIFFLSLTFFLSLGLAAQKTIAVKCGNIVEVRTGKLLTNKIIFIKGNKIESITDAAAFTQKADTMIDLSAYYILPGLIDCHTHVLLQGDITSEDYDVQLLKVLAMQMLI